MTNVCRCRSVRTAPPVRTRTRRTSSRGGGLCAAGVPSEPSRSTRTTRRRARPGGPEERPGVRRPRPPEGPSGWPSQLARRLRRVPPGPPRVDPGQWGTLAGVRESVAGCQEMVRPGRRRLGRLAPADPVGGRSSGAFSRAVLMATLPSADRGLAVGHPFRPPGRRRERLAEVDALTMNETIAQLEQPNSEPARAVSVVDDGFAPPRVA